MIQPRINQWLEDERAPHLNENHCVIMDNATLHKSNKTREIIRRSSARLLLLPPYSPDPGSESGTGS